MRHFWHCLKVLNLTELQDLFYVNWIFECVVAQTVEVLYNFPLLLPSISLASPQNQPNFHSFSLSFFFPSSSSRSCFHQHFRQQLASTVAKAFDTLECFPLFAWNWRKLSRKSKFSPRSKFWRVWNFIQNYFVNAIPRGFIEVIKGKKFDSSRIYRSHKREKIKQWGSSIIKLSRVQWGMS